MFCIQLSKLSIQGLRSLTILQKCSGVQNCGGSRLNENWEGEESKESSDVDHSVKQGG